MGRQRIKVLGRLIGMANLLLLAMASGSLAAEPARLTDAQLQAMIAKINSDTGRLSDVIPIETATKDGNFAKAQEICDAIINRPISDFETAYYGFHIKSLAYLYRAQNRMNMGARGDEVVDDRIEAAKLGNLHALRDLSMAFLAKREIAHVKLPADQLAGLFRAGAELGDAFSAAVIGLTKTPMPIAQTEREYWGLFAIIRDIATSREARTELLHRAIRKLGDAKVVALLQDYSSVGPTLEATKSGLPPRGVMETLFADGNLRGQFGLAHGDKLEAGSPVPEAQTIKEQFDFYSKIVTDVGFGDVYMLVPGENSFDNDRIIGGDRHDIVVELRPNDRVFVRCGPLVHIAILYRKEENGSRLLFTDPNFEYWQPTHNHCVTRFELVEDKHKRFLASVNASEVEGMVQAVITFRNAR